MQHPKHPGRVIHPPPLINMQRVGARNWKVFLESGRRIGAAILEQVGRSIPEGLPANVRVLDFGCGCGRVLYPMVKALPDAVFSAVDVDASAITYLRRNLPGIPLRVNSFNPPLPFDAASFDLVYSVSIWTHLSPADQLAWLDELRRVLRPGGHAFVTTSSHTALARRKQRGDAGWDAVSPEDLDREGVIFIPYGGPDRKVWSPGIDRPYGLTLNSPAHVRRAFAASFEVQQVVVDAIDGVQDLVVLARR